MNNRISEIIKVILNEWLTEQNKPDITQVIIQLAKEYMEENHCTLWDINNGLCEDFAQDVIEEMGGYQDELFELAGDMFFNVIEPEYALENWIEGVIETQYGVWSVKLLEYYGYPPNVDLHKIHDEINHTWIYYNGKHYDAENPNGVDKWYDLLLIKKLFNKYR